MDNKRNKTKNPRMHPVWRAKDSGKEFSWWEAAKSIGVSVRYLKKNYDNLPPELEIAFINYLNGH